MLWIGQGSADPCPLLEGANMIEIVIDAAKDYAHSLFGRRYKKKNPKYGYGFGYQHSRALEKQRRVRQIAAGSLRVENGLQL